MAVEGQDYLIMGVFATEQYARGNYNAKWMYSDGIALINNAVQVANGDDDSERSFYTFVRYWVRVETNDVASEVHIDWGDAGYRGHDPEQTNITIIKSKLPTQIFVTSHIWTRAGMITPMIRCKGINGFLSKWYVNNEDTTGIGEDTNGYNGAVDDSFISPDHWSAAYDQNSFSEVSYVVTNPPRVPYLHLATQPPTAVTKADKKHIWSGIDNEWLGQHEDVRLRDQDDSTMTNSGSLLTAGAKILAQVSRHMEGSTERRTGVQVKITYKDSSTKQVKQKTLTCDGGGTNNKIDNCYEVLKIELLNINENSDSYMNNTGAGETTLAPGERVWIYSNLTDPDSNGLTTEESLNFPNIDNVVGFVSTGNPIMSLDDPQTTVNIDLSESKVRESNVGISAYLFDDNKLIADKIRARIQARHEYATNIITDVLGDKDSGSLGTNSVVALNYSLSRNKNIMDSDYRFFSEKRLIRGQIRTDAHDDWRGMGSYQKYSPIVSFRRNNLSAGGIDAPGSEYTRDGRLPENLEEWTYGMLIKTNEPNAGSTTAPNWTNMVGYNVAGSWPLLTSMASPSVTFGNADTNSSNAIITMSDTDGINIGQNITALGNGTVASIDSIGQITASGTSASTVENGTLILDGANGLTASGGTDITSDDMKNWMFIAHRHKFDRLFWRTMHKRDAYDDVSGDAAASVTKPLNVGTNYPKFNVQLFYPAKKTASATEIVFKPLAYFDGTKDPDTDWSTFIRSGEFIWNSPLDWIKTQHSSDVTYPINNVNFSADLAGLQGPLNLWSVDSWCILVGISMQDSSVRVGLKQYLNIDSVLPYNNTHSTLVEVVDPMHVSLNDRGIASSVSYARKGTWQEITNRLGQSQLRQIGAKSGQIKLGGVDLASANDREKFYGYQSKGTPVYYDVEHKGDGTTTRLFGHITEMSEDSPTGVVTPKFTCSMKITKTLEFNTSTGTITSNGYISLGGDLGGNYNYVPTS